MHATKSTLANGECTACKIHAPTRKLNCHNCDFIAIKAHARAAKSTKSQCTAACKIHAQFNLFAIQKACNARQMHGKCTANGVQMIKAPKKSTPQKPPAFNFLVLIFTRRANATRLAAIFYNTRRAAKCA